MPKRVERNDFQAIDQARIRSAFRTAHPQNLLIIEAKKTSSRIPEDLDREKPRALKSDLQYRYAAFVCFPTAGGVPQIIYGPDWSDLQ